MTRVDDPVSLLLPDLDGEPLARATELARALALFAADARDSGSSSAHVGPDSARSALVDHSHDHVASCLDELARHALSRACGAESFVYVEPPRRSWSDTWERALRAVDASQRREWELAIPLPDERPIEVVRRLADVLVRHARSIDSPLALARADLWRARAGALVPEADDDTHALIESVIGRTSPRPNASSRRGVAPGPEARSLRREALAASIALSLDRRDLVRASEAAARVGPTAREAAECADALDGLVLMARWLTGERDEFPRLEAWAERFGRGLPLAWRELASRLTSDSDDPSPTPADPSAACERDAPTSVSRADVAAAALVVTRLRPSSGALEVAHVDVAPATSANVDDWVRARRFSVAERGTRENRAARTATAAVELAGFDASRLDGTLTGAESARAVAVEPVVDRDGEAIGFVHFEFTHRLIPSGAERRAIARDWAGRWSVAAAPRPTTTADSRIGAVSHDFAGTEDHRLAWSAIVERLQLKTAERRWVAFEVRQDLRQDLRKGEGGEGPTFHPVAEGGDGGERLGPRTRGGAWAVTRAHRTRGAVRYDDGSEPRTQRFLHEGAVCGVALPALVHGNVLAVLVVESVRRGDARPSDVGRWERRLTDLATAIECAAVHARDRAEARAGGFALSVDDPDVARDVEGMTALASSRVDVAFVGAPGTGRCTAARWVHRTSAWRGANGGRLRTLAAYGLSADALRRALSDGATGTVIVTGSSFLDARAQEALVQALDTRNERPRVFLTLEQPDAGLHPELVRALGRTRFRTRPLAEVRHRIPRLARFLARRIGEAEGSPEIELDDAAIAALFRLTLDENVRTLEAILHAAVLRRESDVIGAAGVAGALRELAIEPVPRLPSRDPSRGDLASAAWATRTATGRVNKTRAATYLGWDPSTVATHLGSAGLTTLDDVRSALANR